MIKASERPKPFLAAPPAEGRSPTCQAPRGLCAHLRTGLSKAPRDAVLLPGTVSPYRGKGSLQV